MLGCRDVGVLREGVSKMNTVTVTYRGAAPDNCDRATNENQQRRTKKSVTFLLQYTTHAQMSRTFWQL